MTATLAKIIKALNTCGLPYMVGDESLLGLAEGDLEKYAFNITLYQLPTSCGWMKYGLLSFILLLQGVTVKPKIVHGHFRLKLRAKTGLLKKAPNFIFLIPLQKINDDFKLVERGRSITFPSSSIYSLDSVTYQTLTLSVPHDHQDFARLYRKELLSNKYRQHAVSLDTESAKQAEAMLFKIANILNASRTHWWLEGGTLLGLFRDGKLLDWDHDIDLGLRFESEDQIRELLKQLRKTPYYIKTLDFPEKAGVWNLGQLRLIKVFPRRFYFFHTELCLDLFIFYRESLPGLENPVYKYVVHQKNGYHPAALLDELETLTFKDHQLGRPADTAEFLKSKYGEGWQTPVKEWHVAIDDKTILRNMDNPPRMT